jgi:hypothetical protein
MFNSSSQLRSEQVGFPQEWPATGPDLGDGSDESHTVSIDKE